MKKAIFLFALGWILAVSSARAQMNSSSGVGITKIVITKTEPAFGGISFPNVGPYEFLVGTAYGELDPKDPMNAGIVDLQSAPVNSRGHVEYNLDITFLRPVDLSKANGRLIYDIVNRGHEKVLSDMNLSEFSSIGPDQVTDPASGLLMKAGYTIAWSGWEAEDSHETARPGLLKSRFPIAMKDGKPLTAMSREEISNVPAGPTITGYLTYAAATMDPSAATLTVREHEEDPRKPVPASSWSYTDKKHIKITPVPGYDREALYEFIYPATDAVIEGIAFATIRDFVLFARYAEKDSMGTPNPIHPATPYKAVLGVGVSESGRLLRDMIYQDFNIDSSGRIVFDGAFVSVAGSRKTNVNTEFSQPGRFSRQHEDHLYPGDQFPFTYTTTHDPITGKTDGILVKCTKSHSCPKIMQLDTNTDVWQGRVSLLFTDPSGKGISMPDNVRMYVPTGVPHESKDLPQNNLGTAERGICKEIKNPLKYRLYGRALFLAMDKWVTEGVAPPPSRYPNLKDHTLIPLEQAEKLWPTIPDSPWSPKLNKLFLMDYSKQPPVASGPQYPVYVTMTNADGNPIGGIVPAEITVPIGTYSGRNFRAEGYGEGDLCSLDGSFMPFPATKKERLAKHDSRLSLEERYASEAEFQAKLKKATDDLVKQGYLLQEDATEIAAKPLPKMAAMGDAKTKE
jgi:hypothetical protein